MGHGLDWSGQISLCFHFLEEELKSGKLQFIVMTYTVGTHSLGGVMFDL